MEAHRHEPSPRSKGGCFRSDEDRESSLELNTAEIQSQATPRPTADFEFPSIDPLIRADESNGVWLTPFTDATSLRAAVRRPEFQVACLGNDEYEAAPSTEWSHLSDVIARQVFLRREWYSGEFATTAPLPNRVMRDFQRTTGITNELSNEIRRSIERWIGAFAAATGTSRVKLNFMSERGPRRLELEGGDSPTSFHVDDSGLRLVAPLLGPQTIFIATGHGEGPVQLTAPARGGAPRCESSPFDLDRAVRTSFERVLAPLRLADAMRLRRAPDRFGILFSGSRSSVERPLVHAAPHPRSEPEAIGWARLLITID